MKKLFVCLCLLISLVGCSNESNQETTMVCTLQQDGLTIVNTVVAVGDDVQKQTIDNEVDYSTLGLNKDELTELVKEYEKNYDIKGLDYSFNLGEDKLIETITIDYENANLEELMNIGLIESVEDVKYISLEVTIETLENTGFICE